MKSRSRKAASPEAGDRLPPHAPEAEQGALGCIILSPADCLSEARKRLTHHEAFYDVRHQTIFSALCRLHDDHKPLDVISIHQFLSDRNELDSIGGIPYLNTLQDCVPSASNLSYYLDIVWEKYQLRRRIRACTEVIDQIYDHAGEVEELLDRIDFKLQSVATSGKQSGRFLSVDDLDQFNPDTDSNNRIGNRWLCRGGKLIIPSASGAGKSSLIMQMLTLFALGESFCGIKPHGTQPNGELSSLIVGDENDIGDLAEMFQGTRDFLSISSFEHDQAFALLRKNLKFWHCPALAGEKFLAAIEDELRRDPRDICAIDPLVSFAGVDLTKQDQAAKFLREGLTRIAEETGVIWFIVHHTPKPLREQGKKYTKKISEYQYAGAGSFDLPGWARAVMTLDESTDGIFRLILSKRGARAGATHPDGTPTKVLWMRHASKGIHWEQMEQPDESDSTEPSGAKRGRISMVEKVLALGLGGIIDNITEPIGKMELARRILTFTESKSLDVSLDTCKRAVERLCENSALKKKNELYSKP